jgi:hypothetical protein
MTPWQKPGHSRAKHQPQKLVISMPLQGLFGFISGNNSLIMKKLYGVDDFSNVKNFLSQNQGD